MTTSSINDNFYGLAINSGSGLEDVEALVLSRDGVGRQDLGDDK